MILAANMWKCISHTVTMSQLEVANSENWAERNTNDTLTIHAIMVWGVILVVNIWQFIPHRSSQLDEKLWKKKRLQKKRLVQNPCNGHQADIRQKRRYIQSQWNLPRNTCRRDGSFITTHQWILTEDTSYHINTVLHSGHCLVFFLILFSIIRKESN